MTMTGTHDVPLVWLSILIAVAASYTALDLAGRVGASSGHHRRIWLATAAIVMGGGVWAMHFVAMLAYRMPGMEFGYDPLLTVVSLLVAIAATFASFSVMARERVSMNVLLGAGVFMGIGVVAMHFIGMAAMKMNAVLSYDPLWTGVSVSIAVCASTTALWLAFGNRSPIHRALAAVMMGAAVSGMHYAGMKAAIFSSGDRRIVDTLSTGISQTALALGVTVAAFIILFIALSASVFDRRLAEVSEREASALRQSEERHRSLYRGTPLPLHSLDRNGRIEQVSNTWLELTGYSRDEVVGRPLTDFMTGECAIDLLRREAALLIQNGFINDCECKMLTKSGDVRDVLLSARIERDEHGRFISVLGGLADVTERRRAEEALRQAQKLEAIGQLTGGVAHDFNNLLAVVIGNLDLVRRRVADDPKSLRLVDSAMEGANRGASLTQRLLAFARRQDLKPSAIDVAALVTGMSDLLQRSIGPMVKIETHFRLGLPAAQVDGHQLEMAVLNLAVNARDAMPEGGVLSIGADEVVLTAPEQGLKPGRYLRIDVVDTGIGMDQPTLARASEPFFTTKGVGKGTGLGLSMAQGLAGQSGGRMCLRSAVGQGTTVELWLPISDLEVCLSVRDDHGDASPFRSKSILVVDDDPLVLDNTVAMLEDMGHMVSSASSGSEALEMLPRIADLGMVISDQLMPGMTGVQLAREIAASRPYLPIMLVSGYSDLADDPMMKLPLLAKPFNQRSLDLAIRNVLASSNVVQMDRRRA